MKKLFVFFSFVVGIYYLSSSGYMLMKAELSQYFIIQAWQKTLNDKQNHKPWSWADTYPILQLNVPRLAKTSYALQGESGRNMAFSVVHLAASGMPGDSKSTVLSGHKDSHFSYLKDLEIGDNITTQDKYNSYKYTVTSTKIINSKNEKLSIRNTNELILTTCYPFSDFQFGGSLRFVVYAIPIDSFENTS